MRRRKDNPELNPPLVSTCILHRGEGIKPGIKQNGMEPEVIDVYRKIRVITTTPRL